MGKVLRARPVESTASPAERSLFHGTITLEVGVPVALTDRKCAAISIKPDVANQGEIFIGAESDVDGVTIDEANGFPLGAGIVLGANQSLASVKVYAVASMAGDKVRILGVW